MSESKWKVGGTYKLRDGSEAVVLGAHEGQLFGRVKIGSSWTASDWRADTGFWGTISREGVTSSCDLMPPPAPRGTLRLWLNIYPDGSASLSSLSRQTADSISNSSRIACISVNIVFPEGYGLDKDEPALLVRAD